MNRSATAAHWEHFPHDADMGLRGFGATREQAFEQVALAMTAVITDPQRVAPRDRVELACDAPDDETLLVDWLNALVFEMAARRMLFSRFALQASDRGIRAHAWGEPVDPARHRPAVEVKGATFTGLRVACDDDRGWVAQCVVDV